MITAPTKRPIAIKCPLCPERVDGDMQKLIRHLTSTHTSEENRMGDIIWTNPPHEAVYLGRHYKRAQN